MISKRSESAILIFIALIVMSAARAHGPVARVSEAREFEARLFVADAATGDVVAIDLPGGEVIGRLPTPPYIMQLGASRDQRYLYAMRGRNTDRDFVTIIDTGVNPSEARARPPFIARTLMADTPGGIRGGQVASVGGRDAIFMEGSARIVVMNAARYTDLAERQPMTYELANPDHYHYLESGQYLYVGHLRSGMIQIIDRETRDEVKRIGNCPVAHGMALDAETGRLLFGCARDVVIIGSRGDETNRELGRIPYPTAQRAAAFQAAGDRVLWAYTEGTLPALYRLDLKSEPWSFEVLSVPRAIQQRVTDDGRHLLVFTRAGALQIHDGISGELQRTVEISSPIEDALHEHVDKAILPAIESRNGVAYVSLPHEGQIVAVDIRRGIITESFSTGGEPTRMVLVGRPSSETRVAENQVDTEGRWYTAMKVRTGEGIYQLNCANCHGARGQGNFGAGNMANAAASAPPPLNGSGHSAEHSLEQLIAVIDAGAGAAMPAFGTLLSDAEKRAVIAYMQSLWTNDVYEQWRTGPGRSSEAAHEHGEAGNNAGESAQATQAGPGPNDGNGQPHHRHATGPT